ncbi:beta-barrel assembly-enhancing protease [Microbulbifer aestuariivivens]|uniref:Beta-barrel assembly-enhancing protease n=1 Tax=Microbulbifer aestuariivivens TaxID=1908308 RepID=A0ABP9WNL0_9GAMM
MHQARHTPHSHNAALSVAAIALLGSLLTASCAQPFTGSDSVALTAPENPTATLRDHSRGRETSAEASGASADSGGMSADAAVENSVGESAEKNGGANAREHGKENALPGSESPRRATAATATATAADETIAAKAAQAAIPARAFPVETLYTLLVAEVAGNRERFDVALANYYQQAQSTRDAGVAARATRIARFLNARRAALHSAQLWVELEPDQAEAQLTATAELTLAGELSAALVHAEKALELGGDAPLQSLAATAVSNPQLVKRIAPEFRRLAEKYPNNGEVVLAHGMMLRAAGQYRQALAIVRRVEEEHPGMLDAPLLQSQLLIDLDREEEAFTMLEQMVETYPWEPRIRLQYARLLVNRDLQQAEQQFAILVEQRPQDGNLILSLALIQMEGNHFTAARPLLERLLQLQQHESAAHFYLGSIAEQASAPLRAVAHYRKVEPGNDYMQAISRGTELLAAAGREDENQEWFAQLRQRHPKQSEQFFVIEANLLHKYDQPRQALQLLGAALQQHPGSSRLIYLQASLHEQLGNTEAFEQGMRQLLAQDPGDSALLNALGYKLLDDDSRLQEALQLISRALELNPNDPAIIDSMGWVQYRLGNHAEAIRYLEQALEKLPDHEIAAHLGEVLWMQGNRKRAIQVWQRGLQINPDSEIIPAAMERLKNKSPLEQHVSDH